MSIHQIQVRYDETQDRILLRLSTTEGSEFRFWLTRRFVKQLWGILVQMLEWDQAVERQTDLQARRTVLDIQHEGYAQQANYSKKFEEIPRTMPFGEAPVVLARAQGKRRDASTQVLSLHPQQGQGIDMTLDTKLLHIFSRLLREAVAKADWDINLFLHPLGQQPVAVQEGPPPKLN